MGNISAEEVMKSVKAMGCITERINGLKNKCLYTNTCPKSPESPFRANSC